MTFNRFILIFCVICMSSLQVFAFQHNDIQYSNRKIKQLVEALHLDNLPEKDSLIQVPRILNGKAITIRFDGKGRIIHTGVSLFSQETKRIVGRQFCDFIERYFLELCEQTETEGVKAKLLEYNVKLTYDNTEYGYGAFRSIRKILDEIEMPAGFSLNLQEKQGQGIWLYGGHRLELAFPLYRELIEGTDKQESDELLYIQISENKLNEVCDDEALDNLNGLKSFKKDIYVKVGEQYRINALSSDVYYQKRNRGAIPLFSAAYPVQSLNNLFLTCSYGEKVELQITHRQYGHFTPEVTVPLLVFLNLFKDDFVSVAHTGELKDGTLESFVVFSHKTLNYMHMMRVKTTAQEIFSANPVLKVDFYTNIPQHYLKTLLK